MISYLGTILRQTPGNDDKLPLLRCGEDHHWREPQCGFSKSWAPTNEIVHSAEWQLNPPSPGLPYPPVDGRLHLTRCTCGRRSWVRPASLWRRWKTTGGRLLCMSRSGD